MNANFEGWPKEETTAEPGEEQIDPTFARHQDADFTTVDAVTAAAVANAQHQGAGARDGPQHPDHHHVRGGPNVDKQQQRDAIQQAVRAAHDQDVEKTAVTRGNRPVSNTKRAAQNRSAQKAFRQRKEKYIKDLEAQAAEVNQLKQTIEELRADNLQLRDYTLALQSKVIELSPASGAQHPLGAAAASSGHDSASVSVPTPPAAVYNHSGGRVFSGEK
ncbi:putative transcription factor kapC [Meyerozyma sp. JA9]|nr:putative transcription factor kapC [Meyerozyma sp. JA9]